MGALTFWQICEDYSLSENNGRGPGLTFIETASLQFLFPVQQSSKLMHPSPKIV
jgi:hypothetical protein